VIYSSADGLVRLKFGGAMNDLENQEKRFFAAIAGSSITSRFSRGRLMAAGTRTPTWRALVAALG
jgi:hypothetical protein